MADKVLLIFGEAVGGIRRHVSSIVLDATPEAPEYYFAYSTNGSDQQFIDDYCRLSDAVSDILPLKFGKRPNFRDLANLCKLILFVRRHGIKVVHGHGAKAGVYARLLKLFTSVRVIYSPHGGVLHETFGRLEDMIYLSMERAVLTFTDLILVESCYSKNMFLKRVGAPRCPLVVNYNGVSDYINLTPEPLEEMFKVDSCVHIGVFARFHPMKNVDLAIEVCAELYHYELSAEASCRYHLHLFGDGEKRTQLQSLAESLGCAARVTFHGDVANPMAYMACLNLILVPSRFESFSYVAAEALMMRVPVVAAAVGGLREVLADGAGYLVENPTPKAFASAIRMLVENPELAELQVETGRIRYEDLFRQYEMVSNIEMHYKLLLHKTS